MIKSRYYLRYDLEKEILVINTLTGSVDYFSKEMIGLFDKLESVECSELSGEEQEFIHHLKQRGYVFSSKEEEEKRLKQAMKFATNLDVMQYIICPTYTCNFRCPYCFEDHAIHEKVSIMSDEQLEGVWDAIQHFHQESRLMKGHLHLFGGEPLLPLTQNIIKKICDKAVEWDFRIGCNTNGFHLALFIDTLASYGDRISIAVTIDGPEDIHNQRRILAGGQGTFQQIVRAIGEALVKELRIVVRINIDRSNISRVSELVEYFRENKYLDYETFGIHFAPITDHTCQSTGENLMQGVEIIKLLRRDILDFDELIASKKLMIGPDMWRFMQPLIQLDPELKGHAQPFFPQTVFCESVQGKQIAFGPDSHIYACPDLVGRPEFKIGDYFPQMILNDRKWLKWNEFNSFTISQCKSCSSAPICGGGCAAEALVTFGNLEQPHCTHADSKVYEYLDTIRNDLVAQGGTSK
ncbi:radical SAM/SPASM domain-containing protein [Brevibacillus halotolerans]|uniref:radical SAM/SPASM domain-containing protein n=1 Tax=Brevibacillus halotolerans TaxID=1507437 RepID=UPI0015EEB962|nr:radical SAM protein [Brevibacillus halotolerans]MBA4532857.1 radical SAM protein [Brevibacillus halotolerans]